MRRAVLALLFLLPLLTAHAARADSGPETKPNTVIVVGNHAPPYRIVEKSRFSGIYFDTMREIAKRIDVEVVFMEAPFTRALALMEAGRADIMLGPNRTDEREAYMVYTEARFPAEDKSFYLAPGSPDITEYRDLYGKTVCVQMGKIIDLRFDQDENLSKRESISQLAALQDVLTGKCDTAVLPEQEARWLMTQLGVTLDRASLVLPGRESYLTMSKAGSHLDLQPAIEAAMRSIIADGTFTRILERYR